jgi:hypothetical protein
MLSIPGQPSVFAIPKTFQHGRRYRLSALKVESTIKFIYPELRSYYPRDEAAVIERIVDVHIGKLRQKIESDPANPQYILTERGIGCRFVNPQPGNTGVFP